MRSDGNERLRELLAAEYALGTLVGGARRRFERWMRADTALRDLAFAWSTRLAPLAEALAARRPPARVWAAIEARLDGATTGRATASWATRLGFWRGLSAALAAVAAIAIAVALHEARRPPLVETRVVQAPAPPPEIRTVTVAASPAAVATLADPKTGAPVAIVLASRRGDDLTVEVVAPVHVRAGETMQMWATPNGKDLASIGLLAVSATGKPFPLTREGAERLSSAKAIGLSVEPAGGSPQPTRVVGLGPLVRFGG